VVAAIFAGGDLGICCLGLGEGAVFSEGDDKVQFRVVPLEAVEVHPGEGD